MAGAGYKQWVDGDILTAGDVNTYLMDQAVMVFADAAARTAAITSPTEGMISFRKDDNVLEYYTGSAWAFLPQGLRQVVTFTTSGNFTKASYPWLRAMRVYLVGGGGGGAGAGTTTASQAYLSESGGGGGYAESFITDIAGLASSVTVTVGSGGAGGTGAANGSTGGASSFGALVAANGGNGGGQILVLSNNTGSTVLGGAATAGDIQLRGGPSRISVVIGFLANQVNSGGGGASQLGAGAAASRGSANGNGGYSYGGGGGGAAQAESQATARNGGVGAAGIVVVELYG